VDQVYKDLDNPQIETNLFKSANNLNTRFRGNWFTLAQIVKKTSVSNPIHASQLMNMLEMRGLAIKLQHKGEEKYKISISKELQIANLESQIAALDNQKNNILKLIASIKFEGA